MRWPDPGPKLVHGSARRREIYWTSIDVKYILKPMKRRFAYLSIVLLSLTQYAATVTVERVVPASINMAGIKKVVVLPFTYVMTYHEAGSNSVANELRSALKKNGFFEVLEPDEKIELKMDEKVSIPTISRLGKKYGADAVITGKITAFHIEKGPSILRFEDVSFYLDLIRVSNGKTLEHKYFTTNVNQQTFASLVKHISRQIGPHKVAEKIPIEDGKPCQDGAKRAKKGEWSESVRLWEEVLSKDPGCACALYNLGLAAEIGGDYGKALQYFEKAVAVKPDEDDFKNGVSRIKQKINDEKVIKLQTKGKSDEYLIQINRKEHKLSVLDNTKKTVFETPCGIGRGGLAQKKGMSDHVTPTGEFVVDIILYGNASFNEISKENSVKFSQDKRFKELISNKDGLKNLFNNMNSIDFDKNGGPDFAYGDAYIGLNSKTAVTGPKIQMYGATPYWYSIAIHGTPDQKNIGKSMSGGCVHVDGATLKKLIEGGYAKIGTKVVIHD